MSTITTRRLAWQNLALGFGSLATILGLTAGGAYVHDRADGGFTQPAAAQVVDDSEEARHGCGNGGVKVRIRGRYECIWFGGGFF